MSEIPPLVGFAFAAIICATLAFRELHEARAEGESTARAALVLVVLGVLSYGVFWWKGVQSMPSLSPFLIAFQLVGMPISLGGLFLIDRANRHKRSQWPGAVLIIAGVLMLFFSGYR